jgi:hypothetical protein
LSQTATRKSEEPKLLTQLFQAAVRSKTYLDELLGDLASGEKVSRGLDDALMQLSLKELREFVAERLAAFRNMNFAKSRLLWQKNREKIESAYTIDSLLRTLAYFLDSSEPLPRVINLGELARHWSAIEAGMH